MPIYSYKCESCGEIFDRLVKSGENGKVLCIHCNSVTKRVFSPVGIIFKGSGFYSTDYKTGTKGAGSVASSGEKSKKDSQKTKTAASEKSKPAEKVKSSK
jgi:putative FmdB family regulatory protein